MKFFKMQLKFGNCQVSFHGIILIWPNIFEKKNPKKKFDLLIFTVPVTFLSFLSYYLLICYKYK